MSIEIEYKQWFFMFEEMFEKVRQLFPFEFERKEYECKNAIYHWLVYVNQDRSIVKYEHFPLLPKIGAIDEPAPEVALKLVKWIEEKKLFSTEDEEYNKEESHLAVKRLLDYIQEKHDELQLEGLTFQPIRELEEIQFGEFTSQNYEKLSDLLDKISDRSWSLEDITKMILRYESFGNHGSQWSFPTDLYTCLYDEFGVRFEGFASPLNAHLSGQTVNRLQVDCKFCSLFPDTDAVFGSMGNFFDIELSEYPGAWLINPPFVEDILDKVATKVIDALDSGVRGTYFCIYPFWHDNESWQKLNSSEHTVKALTELHRVVQKDVFGKIFSPYNTFSFFCLSFDRGLDLLSVKKILKKTLTDYK